MRITVRDSKRVANGIRTLLLCHDDGCHYVISTVTNPDGALETAVFPAKSCGELIECTDILGGVRISHADAIARMQTLSAAQVAAMLDSY